MGKVIKGSSGSDERYTVCIPALGFGVPARAAEPVSAGELDTFAEPEFEVPAPPEIDYAALEAQANEIVDAAERNARAIVDEAEDRARAIVDEANLRAQTVAADARRTGHDQGYAAGNDEAQTTMGAMLDTMRELLEATRTERHALLASAESELVRLAVGIAERVLHQQIALDNGVVVEMARAAISRIVDREKITVRVNPADIERMREHREELLALGDVKTMRVVEDQRVDRGGVIVETDAGSIDAKISTQLAEVRKILHIVDDVVVTAPAAEAADDDDETALTAARAS